MGKKTDPPPLQPTVAISDAFNAAGHALAAALVWHRDDKCAAYGFVIVALAATAGVLRFGFSEQLFARLNKHLAHTSAFIGLPLVGVSFAQAWLEVALGTSDVLLLMVGLVLLSVAALSLPDKLLELAKILVNLVAFLAPIVGHAHKLGDLRTAAGVALFAVAGIWIGGGQGLIFGVKRVNVFHYAIGLASYMLALGLA